MNDIKKIERLLRERYKREHIITQELERARKELAEDKKYFLHRKLFGTRHDNMCFAIFYEDGQYRSGCGWGKSKVCRKNYSWAA